MIISYPYFLYVGIECLTDLENTEEAVRHLRKERKLLKNRFKSPRQEKLMKEKLGITTL